MSSEEEETSFSRKPIENELDDIYALTELPSEVASQIQEHAPAPLPPPPDTNPDQLHERIRNLTDEENVAIQQQLETLGIEIPLDDTGNKVVTEDFLKGLNNDILTVLFPSTIPSSNRHSKVSASIASDGPIKRRETDVASVPSGVITTTQSVMTNADVEAEGERFQDEDDWEMELADEYKQQLGNKLAKRGIVAPIDKTTGKAKYTKLFVNALPKDLAKEIFARTLNKDGRRLSAFSSDDSSPEDDTITKALHYDLLDSNISGRHTLGLRFENGSLRAADETGKIMNFEDMVEYLNNAYSDNTLSNHTRETQPLVADLRAKIEKDRKDEETDPDITLPSDFLEMSKLAMKFVPGFKNMPGYRDPVYLFESLLPKDDDDVKATESTIAYRVKSENDNEGGLVHLLPPYRNFIMEGFSSVAEITSSIARQLSVQSMRGSLISTHLSDLPSTYSQALIDEPSTIFMSSASAQKFDISRETIRGYRQKWLTTFMAGTVPPETFSLCITNTVTLRDIELRVVKTNTVNEVCHLYMQYESHPENYVWKDVHGRVLAPDKTLIENGLVRLNEVLQYNGYRRQPVIMLHFRDGSENDPPMPLHPLHALRINEPRPCENS